MFEYTLQRVLLEQVAKMRISAASDNPPKDAENLLLCIKHNQDFAFAKAHTLPKLFSSSPDDESFIGATYSDFVTAAYPLIKFGFDDFDGVDLDDVEEFTLEQSIAGKGVLSTAALAMFVVYAELTEAVFASVEVAKRRDYFDLIRVPGVDDKVLMNSLEFYAYILNTSDYLWGNTSPFRYLRVPNFKNVVSKTEIVALAHRFHSVYNADVTLDVEQINFVLGVENV